MNPGRRCCTSWICHSYVRIGSSEGSVLLNSPVIGEGVMEVTLGSPGRKANVSARDTMSASPHRSWNTSGDVLHVSIEDVDSVVGSWATNGQRLANYVLAHSVHDSCLRRTAAVPVVSAGGPEVSETGDWLVRAMKVSDPGLLDVLLRGRLASGGDGPDLGESVWMIPRQDCRSANQDIDLSRCALAMPPFSATFTNDLPGEEWAPTLSLS